MHKNLFELLEQQPDKNKLIYQVDHQCYSISDVINSAKSIAVELKENNVLAKTKVLLMANDSIQWVHVFWALNYVGSEIFVLSNKTDVESIAEYCKTHNIEKICTDSDLSSLTIHADVYDIKKFNCNTVMHQLPAEYDCQDVVINFSTSGTSSNIPSVVPHTLSNLIEVRHSIKNLFDLCQIDSTSTLLCSAKFSFVWGFCVQLLGPLLFGTKNLIATSSFAFKDLAATCRCHNVTNLIVNPYLLKLFNSNTQSIPDSLRSVTVGGEVLPFTVASDFEKKFDIPLINCYGLTETLFTVIGGVFDTNNPNSIGTAFSNVSVRIVDDQHQEVPAGTAGRLIIKTNHQCHRYYDNDHSDSFVNGWFYTSDFALMDLNNHVVFLGRLNSCIKSKGEWYSLIDVENNILKMSTVDDCVVFQSSNTDDTPAIFAVVATSDHTITQDCVWKFLKEKNQKKFLIPSTIKFVQELPRTNNLKKIRSHKMFDNLLQGSKHDI